MLSVVVSIVVILRVGLVSHFNSTTAGAIVEYQSAPAVFLGAIASFFPTVMFVLAMVALVLLALQARKVFDQRSEGVEWLDVIWLAIGVLIVATYLTYSDWLLVVIVVAVPLLVFFAKDRSSYRLSYLLGGLILLFQLVALSDSAWLPAEAISVTSQDVPVVGYVLGEDGGWTSILLDDDRLVILVRTKTIVSRQVCSVKGTWAPVRSLWTHQPGYAKCDELQATQATGG
jgi:hypothetical protein